MFDSVDPGPGPGKKLCVTCDVEYDESRFKPESNKCILCDPITPEDVERERAKAREAREAAARARDEKKRKAFDAVQAAKQELATRTLIRKRLLPFVERFNPDYLAGWVHKDICQRLEQFSRDVVDRKSPRLMLFMPPRHGKSTIASVAFPAWHLGRNPEHEFIACSYSGSLAMTFSRKVRQLVREPSYKTAFKTRLDPDSQSAEAWLTTESGGYVAAGVGGGITGKGAHILVIDDPVKNREDAESENNRESNYDWFTSTAYTRLAPGGGILIILTRWHDDDLAGRLLSEADKGGEQWEVVSYPAIAQEDEPYRKMGQALHRERYDEEALARIERAVGPRDWSALYQQNPVADDGDYFTRDMIRHFDPEQINVDNMVYYAAWDFAIGQKEKNDYTVGIVCGVDDNDDMYIVDMVRGRWDGMEIVEQVIDMYELWKPSIVGMEKGHINMALGPFLEKRIAERGAYSMYVKDLSVGRRDKELRARTIQGRLQQGKVFIPRQERWTDLLVAEMLRFPNGVHDDCVDALAWLGLMITEMRMYQHPREAPPPSWRDKLGQFITGSEERRRSAMSS